MEYEVRLGYNLPDEKPFEKDDLVSFLIDVIDSVEEGTWNWSLIMAIEPGVDYENVVKNVNFGADFEISWRLEFGNVIFLASDTDGRSLV